MRRTQNREPQSSPKIRTRKPLRKALKNNHLEAFWSSGASGALLACSRHRFQSGPERGSTVAGSLDTFCPLSRPPRHVRIIEKQVCFLSPPGRQRGGPFTYLRPAPRGAAGAGHLLTYLRPAPRGAAGAGDLLTYGRRRGKFSAVRWVSKFFLIFPPP